MCVRVDIILWDAKLDIFIEKGETFNIQFNI